jgi:hypothetical protein
LILSTGLLPVKFPQYPVPHIPSPLIRLSNHPSPGSALLFPSDCSDCSNALLLNQPSACPFAHSLNIRAISLSSPISRLPLYSQHTIPCLFLLTHSLLLFLFSSLSPFFSFPLPFSLSPLLFSALLSAPNPRLRPRVLRIFSTN